VSVGSDRLPGGHLRDTATADFNINIVV